MKFQLQPSLVRPFQSAPGFILTAVFPGGTVCPGYIDPANVTAILGNHIVDMVVHIHLRGHGHRRFGDRIVYFFVLLLGHLIQDMEVLGTGGNDLVNRRIHHEFGGGCLQHIALFIPDHIAHLVPVKGGIQPVSAVILIKKRITRTAQLPGCIPEDKLIGQIVGDGPQGFLPCFLQSLFP